MIKKLSNRKSKSRSRRTRRLCLKCGRKFISKHHYNRICEKCGIVNARTTSSMYAVSEISSEKPELFGDHFYRLNWY